MVEKRKKQWMNRNDGNKRHKGALGAAATAKGHGGVLVTCDKTKERQSVADALNILNEAADKFYPVKDEEKAAEDSKESADSVQKKLQEEIAALQSQSKSRQTGRFTPLDTGVKGAILIQCKDDDISVVELLDKLFAEVETSKEFTSRFITRMIPLEKIGYSSVEAIKEMATPMIKSHVEKFREEQKKAGTNDPLEFAVEFKRRNCTNLDSMDVINALVDIVGPEDSKVNLTTPHSVLLMEVFRNTCGFSVVTNFHRYKKYNARSIIDPPVPGQQTQKKDKKEVKKEKDETDDTKPAEDEAKLAEGTDKEKEAVQADQDEEQE